MIVAVASNDGAYGRAILSNLAVLRARSGRKVLVLDTDGMHDGDHSRSPASIEPRVTSRGLAERSVSAEIEQALPRCQDILLDMDGGNSPESRAALIAARLVVVPVQAQQVDLGRQYKLIAQLNSARMFNPSLHVLFVVTGGAIDPDPDDMIAIRAYVAQVMSARLCSTVVHDHLLASLRGDGMCACQRKGCDGIAAAEMVKLYDEVFMH